MDTVATNKRGPGFFFPNLCMYALSDSEVFHSAVLPSIKSANPLVPPLPAGSPDPSSEVKPVTQMATLSFKGVLSSYTLPNHSF